jgi:hypothetical protein
MVFSTVPRIDVHKLEAEITMYENLRFYGVKCPAIYSSLLLWTAPEEVRVGYLMQRLTGREFKFMQFGLLKRMINGWPVDKLKTLHADIMTITKSNVSIGDLQVFVQENGELFVFDPNSASYEREGARYPELELLLEHITELI